MPYDEVMHKFKHGLLHSGSKHGKKVTNRKQAIAIMLSEKRKADEGHEEYQSQRHGVGPSSEVEHEITHKKRKRA